MMENSLNPELISDTVSKIVQTLKTKTGRKNIRTFFKEQKTALRDSKLEGIPFIPRNGKYPSDTTSDKEVFDASAD